MTPLRAVKGMNDVLPDEVGGWQRVERAYAHSMSLHGFREVRGKKARAHIDEAAACAILQSWLDARRVRRKQP